MEQNFHEQPANDNQLSFKNADVEKLHQLADHLENITDDAAFEKKVQEYADILINLLHNHTSIIGKAYKHLQTGWDKLPHGAQWAILKGEAFVPFPIDFSTLVEMGLIKYKGHASPQDRDEQLKEKRQWELKSAKWGARIATIFAPEVEAIVPFLEPIEKLRNTKAKVLKIFRNHLDRLQIEQQTEGKQQHVIDNLVPPANDNALSSAA